MMTQEKNRFKATIAGKEYTIIGPEDRDHMSLVTSLVNQQLKEIQGLSSDISLERASILLAINAVSDQVKKQEEVFILEEELKAIDNRIKRVDEIENRLKELRKAEKSTRDVSDQMNLEDDEISIIEAQRIINERAKEKIKQSKREKK